MSNEPPAVKNKKITSDDVYQHLLKYSPGQIISLRIGDAEMGINHLWPYRNMVDIRTDGTIFRRE